jgi:hypothetical protein
MWTRKFMRNANLIIYKLVNIWIIVDTTTNLNQVFLFYDFLDTSTLG